MGQIVLLDELTINKIAAGEVIERPSSVVKEMVENSIDAGATNISIEIKNGGISYIRITDNGKGIAQDDVQIAFERHATSKIRVADDLSTVKSMGFRGEALASIAAISNVELISRTEDMDFGTRIAVEAGKVLDVEEKGCQIGTTITVTNLFFNTPVRYKFLKKDFTEGGYIEDIITRLALINPNIAFKVISSGKTILQTSGNGELKDVIYSIYGKDIANSTVDVEYEYEDIKVTGVVGKPEIARSNRSNQMFFVNNRFVKDKTLSASTDEAYRTIIPNGKFGFVVLNIMLNPEQVDVNVHPAKLEVRFSEESKVFKAILHSIKNSLLGEDLIRGMERTMENSAGTGKRFKEDEKAGNLMSSFKKLMNTSNKSVNVDNANNKLESVNNDKTIVSENNSKPSIEEINKKLQIKNDSANTIEELFKIKETLNLKNGQSSVNVSNGTVGKEKDDWATAIETEITLDENVNFDEMYRKYFGSKEDIIGKDIEDEVDNLNTEISGDLELNDEEIILGNDDSVNPKESISKKIENDEDDTENIDKESPLINDIENNKVFDEQSDNVIEPKIENDVNNQEEDEKPAILFEQPAVYKAIPPYKIIGAVFATYIIIEMEDGIYIIDQHAAHERVMYEEVKKNFYSDSKMSQMMLLPDIITLTHKETELIVENIELFEKSGFIIEEFGQNTIKLMGVPSICIDLDTKELFLDILDETATGERSARQVIEEKFIATVACKAAVKANMKLKHEEILELIEKILVLENPFTCPHGRPTAIHMTKYEMEKKFGRV